MPRTFVSVELRDRRTLTRFAAAMVDLGFQQSVTGRKNRQQLQLPAGMFLLDDADAAKALELAKKAVRTAEVEARIFCIPAGDDIRFGNLLRAA